MSQSRQSACIPPPSDYSQHRGPSGNQRSRPDRGGYRARPSFHNDRDGGGSRRHHQPTTFHRDQAQHYDSQLKESEPKREQPQDRFHRNDDDDYFAAVQDEECSDAVTHTNESGNCNEEDEEDDPLDAYMRSLDADARNDSQETDNKAQASDELVKPSRATSSSVSAAGGPVRLDIDGTEDLEASFYEFLGKQRNNQQQSDHDEQQQSDKQDLIEYDKDGNIISVRKIKREVDPLPPIDHSSIEYKEFERIFYQEHDEISKLTDEQSNELRKKLEISVSGQSPPRPVCSFAHFNFEEKLLKVIRRSEYVQPTPIQAQAIPAALAGRNLIGIAMTGSGKTAAYLLPMIVHINGQPELKSGDGPIGLILVPTRELALQVYSEARKFSSSYKFAVVCAYGGGSKFEQSRDLESGAEIVVATPGRLIDLIKSGATNLKRVTYLVLDEADRFFEMGFEAQVRSICDHIRPDRQCLLFSATFKHKVEQLARTITENPVKIVQKTLGEANEDVQQHVVVVPEAEKKWSWLASRLVEFTSAGSVLIFVTRIVNSEELHKRLLEAGRDTLLLHGDMEQSERNRVIMCFKRKEKDVLVATDVAARGLDISHIRTVINFDVARDIDTHVHRIGRTGRAGLRGDAYTLLSADKDKDFAGHLVRHFESASSANQSAVDEQLLRLAMQSHAFRRSRQQKGQRHLGREHSGSSAHYQQHRQANQHHHHHHHQNQQHQIQDNKSPSQYTRGHHHDLHRQNQAPSSSKSASWHNQRATGSVKTTTTHNNEDAHRQHKRGRWHYPSTEAR